MNESPKSTDCRRDADQELIGVLMAISVVSRRLATKLTKLSQLYEGGKTDEYRECSQRTEPAAPTE